MIPKLALYFSIMSDRRHAVTKLDTSGSEEQA